MRMIKKYTPSFLLLIFSFIIAINYEQVFFNVSLSLTFLYTLYFSRVFYYIVSLPILIISFISTNTLASYGGFNDGIIISILETNSMESMEFIRSLGFYNFIYFIFIFILLVLLPILIKNRKNKNNVVFFMILIFINFSFFKYLNIKNELYFQRNILITLGDFQNSILSLVRFINENKKYHYKYEISEINRKYKVHVLIIGESVSKKYMSLYGYPLKTTPFLDQVNKKYIQNYISTAGYTILSIPRTISENDNDIISLANQSGLETYWLSNQNVSGTHDSENTKIALNSKYIYFLNRGKIDDDSHNDNELLPYFRKIIIDNDKSDKLIVIHLRGSHYNFNERLGLNAKRYLLSDLELSDYLSTIYQTDQLLEEIFKILKSHVKSFSIVYFSDHGLNNMTLKHGQNTKDNFDIPFIEISNDFIVTEKVDISQSAYHFMDFFEDWIGVRSSREKFGSFYDGVLEDTIKVYADGLKRYSDLDNSTIRESE